MGARSYQRDLRRRRVPAASAPRSDAPRRGSVDPCLITPHRTFKDSTDILKFVDRVGPVDLRLYPEDPVTKLEVEQLEDLFDKRRSGLTHVDGSISS